MDVNPKDEISHTTQYCEAFLKYVEQSYCAQYRPMCIIKPENVPGSNFFPSAKAARFG